MSITLHCDVITITLHHDIISNNFDALCVTIFVMLHYEVISSISYCDVFSILLE